MIYNKEYFEKEIETMIDKVKKESDYSSLSDKELQMEVSFLIIQAVTYAVFKLFKKYITIEDNNYKLYFDMQEIVDIILFCLMSGKQFNLKLENNYYKITHNFNDNDYETLILKIKKVSQSDN